MNKITNVYKKIKFKKKKKNNKKEIRKFQNRYINIKI